MIINTIFLKMFINNSSVASTSLFPAYSSEQQKNDDLQGDKDWLCNSSYNPSNFKETQINNEVCTDPTTQSKDEIKTKVVKEKIKSIHLKKVKKKHKSSSSYKELYEVPESDSIRCQLNKKTFIEETGLSYERAFRVDPKPDPENIYYECLEQKNIASYKIHLRFPAGLNYQEQIQWQKLQVPSGTKDKSLRYFHKKALRAMNKIKSTEVNNINRSVIVSTQVEFIPISTNNKSAFSGKDPLTSNFDGVSKSWQYPETPTLEDDPVVDISPVELELQNKTKLFNKRVTESPHNIQLWLDFVDFQNELMLSGPCKSVLEAPVIEKKIAILDKALTHNPKSLKLNITKLNLCRHIWKIEKLVQFWDNLVFVYPNDINVWQEYISFILTDLTYFNTSRVLKVFNKCLTTLSELNEGNMKSHKAPPNVVNAMIDIFSQLCYVLKNCGHCEKAVALFQALIEFNLFNPPSTESVPISDRISYFEPFWDSGLVRCGEENATGWAVTISEKKIVYNKLTLQTDFSNIEDEILGKKLSQSQTWLEFEKLRASRYWLPWRPNPEYGQENDDIDDPDRIIAFESVSKFLFRISSEKCKFLLVVNFLSFLGYNPHTFCCNIFRKDNLHTFIDISNYDVISQKIQTLFKNQISSPLCLNVNIPFHERINFIENLFAQTMSTFSIKYRSLLCLLWVNFRKYCSLSSDTASKQSNNLKKFVKNMLKESENRNFLALWIEYIKLEMSTSTKAKSTFNTLLISSSAAVVDGSMESKDLWYFIRSFIELCVNFEGDHADDKEILTNLEIIRILTLIGAKEKYNICLDDEIKPTLILKAISCYKSFIDNELCFMSNRDFGLCYCIDPSDYSMLDCAMCLSYLQYYTKGIDASIAVFEDLSKSVEDKIIGKQKRYILEQIYVARAEFLNFHTWNSTASIRPLQQLLHRSTEEFPNNSKLLYLLVKLRTASSLISASRRHFTNILKKNSQPHLVTWIFALASEFSLCYAIIDKKSQELQNSICGADPFCCGITWKIRALYEYILESPSCSSIPVIWRSYIKFEMHNQEIGKAKGIFYKAMQNSGWCKALLMDGIKYFPEDTKQIIDYMSEKQIRVHTPLEEVELLMSHTVEDSE